ncbi:MAG TPA: TIGR01777 family oxidoreductase [Oligoflexia bacterium]|nr:TIGR01777 family oxidoreductase [Oligoflexia bacterium]HMP48635.1 TIGR01777 family oxidoreductase [Oligoflexia bacterium]
MNILLTGGTGLIGTRLIELGCNEGHSFIVLTRKIPESKSLKNDNYRVEYSLWNPENEQIDLDILNNVDAVINLAGENIASHRWTKKIKLSLMESRIKSTQFIRKSILSLEHPPPVFISASATGYYREKWTGNITEEGDAGSDFINEICKAWEREAQIPSNSKIRTVQARIGIVLSRDGGALKKMLFPFKLGLGGCLGSGKQYLSWISLDDIVRALLFCIDNEKMRGAVNFTSPKPVTNKQFTIALGKALGKPAIFQVPAFLLRLVLGEMADQLLLRSLPVVPEKLLMNRFEFKDKDLEDFLKKIVR